MATTPGPQPGPQPGPAPAPPTKKPLATKPKPAPTPKPSTKSWPSSMSGDERMWMNSVGISPDKYSGMSSSLQKRYHARYDRFKSSGGGFESSAGTSTTSPDKRAVAGYSGANDALAKWLRASGIDEKEWAGMSAADKEALRAVFETSGGKVKGKDDAAIDPNSIGLGAQDLIADPQFFEFVPPVFLPSSQNFAYAQMDAWAANVLERRLRPEERERLLAVWRTQEKHLYDNETRQLRAEHAREIVGKDQFYPGSTPPAKGTDEEAALLQQAAIPPDAVTAEAKKRMGSFEKFTEQDFQLAIQQAIGSSSPKEEAGVELRGAFEGLLGAIRGYVNPDQFAPPGRG